jgi:hypothetical protein
MTEQIILLLLILGTALLLFSLERIPADVVALGVLMSLISGVGPHRRGRNMRPGYPALYRR